MSVSSLPEWKQLLLERKRREEEERERREREEEERLASMPAWKRGIIQRRRAKQEGGGGERDREREGIIQADSADGESYILTQTSGEMTITLESERPQCDLHPIRAFGRVSMENIGPIRQNPFIKSQSEWKKSRELEKGVDVQEKGTDAERGGISWGQDRELVRGRAIEIRTERYRDRSEGRERDRSLGRESGKDKGGEKDRENIRIAKEGPKDPDTTLFPLVPGLRTIKAENIIIIEKDRRGSEREEKIAEKVVEREREKQQEEEEEKGEGSGGGGGGGEKRGMRMDLREILAGGGSVTEIRATEVLIIKPGGADDRSTAAKISARDGDEEEEDQGEAEGQEVQRQRDRRSSSEDRVEGERERPREASRAADQEQTKEKASVKESAVWPRPQREERELSSNNSTGTTGNITNSSSSENSGLLERGGRVSQLLSKFGEHPKPPSRSKSSECFMQPSRETERTGREGSSDELSRTDEGQGEQTEREAVRGVPKRSFSFSDRVICAKENGLHDEGYHDRRAVERTFSDRRAGERPERGTKPKVLLRWRHGDKQAKPSAKPDVKIERSAERQSEIDRDSVKRPNNEVVTGEKTETPKERPTGQVMKMTQDEGFTMASVKNTEGIAFAHKVSIRQEGKEKAVEREAKRNKNVTDEAGEKPAERITDLDIIEREMERDRMIEREKEWERQIERQIEEKKQSSMWRAEAESKLPQCMCIHPSEMVNSVYVPSSPSRVIMSAATELSNVPRSPTVKDADIGGRSDWESTESQEHLLSETVLSQHTEELISKIGRVRDKKLDRENRRRTQPCVYVDSGMTSSQEFLDADVHSPEDQLIMNNSIDSPYDGCSGSVYKEEPLVLKSPKRSVLVGLSTAPEEIQIPRTVFYGVDMAPDRPKVHLPSMEGPEGGMGGGEVGGKGLERRESWKAGRPLTRIESLREKIRQRELEKQTAKDAGMADGERGESRERDTEVGETEKYKERWKGVAQERAAEERKKMGWEMEGGGERDGAVVVLTTVDKRRQEEPLPLTDSPFDVTQELGVSRASPQLPVPLSISQPLSAEKQDSGAIYTACTLIAAFSARTEDVEVEELTQHVEEPSGDQVWRHRDTDTPQGLGGVGDERGGGEELPDEDYLPPSQTSSPATSLSPSPPLSHSLAAMSRIYNLKTVGSRTGVCISERPVEVVSHKSLPHEDYRPFRPKSTPEPVCHPEVQVDCVVKVEHPWESSDEPLSVLSVQRQVEQLRLREQEARRLAEKSITSEKEIKVPPGQQREETQQLRPGDGQTKDRLSTTGPRTPPPTVRAQPRPKVFSGPAPENARKHLERPTAPVPPSSPSTLSPSPTHTPSPSSSPSPPLFSIRSASSGLGKRGTTITITPRKPAGAVASPGSPSISKPAGQAQMPPPNGTGEGGKKRYPTAEEIQVIGGYQNLEKSCLVKSRGTANKGVS